MKIYEDLIAAIEEMINTSMTAMAPYPVDVVGRPAPFGKLKSKKKSHGEKRAPHTEIHEEYEKQKRGSEKSAMYKYSYKKAGQLRKVMEDIATLCEAMIEEGRQEGESQAEYKERLKGNFLDRIKSDIANTKAARRNAKKIEKDAQRKLGKVSDDSVSALILKDDLRQNRHKKFEASDKVKELTSLKDKFEK